MVAKIASGVAVDELKARICACVCQLKDTAKLVTQSWVARLEMVVKADGGHFEHTMTKKTKGKGDKEIVVDYF